MSSDTEVGITANATPFTREMERAAQAAMTSGQRIQSAFREAGKNMADSMTGALDRINTNAKASMGVLEHYKGAVAAIGVMVGAFVTVATGAKRLADESYAAAHANELLGSKLGLSGAQAGVLSQALDNMNSDSATLEDGLGKVTEKLLNNEAAFTKLGVATRDGNGNFRSTLDILKDANARFLEFREGTDRNIEMQKIYGETWRKMIPLLGLTQEAVDETAARMRELGLVMSRENVAAAHAYDDALDDVGMVLEGLRKAAGDALMPVLTKLSEWFSSIGPEAITVIKGSVGGLTAAFWLLTNGVAAVWETINAMVVTVAEPLRAVSEAITRAMTGDFKGAWAALGRGGQTMVDAWKTALAEMEKSSRETRDEIWNLFANGTPMAAVKGDGMTSTGGDGKKAKTQKAAGGKTMTDAEWDMEVLAWERRTQDQLAELDRSYRSAALEREIADLHDRANLAGRASDERLQLLAEAAARAGELYGSESEKYRQALAAMNAAAQQSAELRAQAAFVAQQSLAAAQLDQVDQVEALARHDVEMGRMTQADLLTLESDFEARRYAIRLQALQDRLALVDPDHDPVAYAQTLAALEELYRQHQARIGEIGRAVEADASAPMLRTVQSVEQTLSGSIQRLMTLQTNFAGAMRSLFQGVAQAISGELAKMAANWIMTQIGLKAAGKATALGEIMANAGKAGAAGTASMAAAPWPISMGAPAFGAAMAAAAAAFAPMASAAGGYDIPSGINPVVQTHAREMILPAQYADVIRDIAAAHGGGGGEGAGNGIRIVNVIDPDLAAEFMQSPAGERIHLNHIRANAGVIRQWLL